MKRNTSGEPVGPETRTLLEFLLVCSKYLRDANILEYNRARGVVQFARLTDTGRLDGIYDLRHRIRIDNTMCVAAGAGADAERKRARCSAEAACLVGTKAILASQGYCETPAGAGCAAKRGRGHPEGDVTRDRVCADGNRAHPLAAGILIGLPKALHFQQTTPGTARTQCYSCGWHTLPRLRLYRL